MTTFDWAIIEDGGVSDRFATEAEAQAELPNYSSDATVEYSPAPAEFDLLDA